jgi:hypothetical protein
MKPSGPDGDNDLIVCLATLGVHRETGIPIKPIGYKVLFFISLINDYERS